MALRSGAASDSTRTEQPLKSRFRLGVGRASIGGGKRVEPDVRYYRRRANEELSAANRAVTAAARERRMQLAGVFLDRLKTLESSHSPAFEWAEQRAVEHA